MESNEQYRNLSGRASKMNGEMSGSQRLPQGSQNGRSQVMNNSYKNSEFLEDNLRYFERHYMKSDPSIFHWSAESFFQVPSDNLQKIFQTEDTLYRTPQLSPNKTWSIKCQQSELRIHPSQKLFDQTIMNAQEILGATVEDGSEKTRNSEGVIVHKLVLHRLIRRNSSSCCCTCKSGRESKRYYFYHEDLGKLHIWKNLIHYMANTQKFLEEHKQALISKHLEPFQGVFLVYVNPAGGSGKAQEVWAKAQRLLTIAGYKFNVLLTTRRNYAYDHIQELSTEELVKYKGILTVSGDGLPHEVINALMHRPDRELIADIPIGALPGGSGNAIVTNLAQASDETDDIEGMVMLIAKGQTRAIDLLQVQMDSQESIVYSFLSVSFAYIADLDLNSEFMRCCGEFRFDLYGTYRALFQRLYPCRLCVFEDYADALPQDLFQELAPASTEENERNVGMREYQLKYFLASNMPYISKSCHSSPLCGIDDGHIDLQYMEDVGYCQMLSLCTRFSNGEHFNAETQAPCRDLNFTYKKIKAFRIECLSDRRNTNDRQVQPDTNPLMSASSSVLRRGLFSIDGERYEARVLQARVLPGVIKVFAMGKSQEETMQNYDKDIQLETSYMPPENNNSKKQLTVDQNMTQGAAEQQKLQSDQTIKSPDNQIIGKIQPEFTIEYHEEQKQQN